MTLALPAARLLYLTDEKDNNPKAMVVYGTEQDDTLSNHIKNLFGRTMPYCIEEHNSTHTHGINAVALYTLAGPGPYTAPTYHRVLFEQKRVCELIFNNLLHDFFYFVDELESYCVGLRKMGHGNSIIHPSWIRVEQEVIETEDLKEETTQVTAPLIEIKDANMRRRNK